MASNYLDKLPQEILEYIYFWIWKCNMSNLNKIINNYFVWVHNSIDLLDSPGTSFSERVTLFNNKTRLTRYILDRPSEFSSKLFNKDDIQILKIVTLIDEGIKNIYDIKGEFFDSFILS